MLAAIDIGGTKTRLLLANTPTKIVREAVFPTPADLGVFTHMLTDELKKLIKTDTIKAMGIACKGPIDRKQGTWKEIPILSELQKVFSMPIVFEHDATAGGIAETKLGSGKGHSVVLYITISTGIGTAILVDGRPLPGPYNSEGGYQIIQARPFPGKSWQHLASGEAIAQRYHKIARDIHDPDTWQDISQDLATGIFNLANIVQPHIIVLAGGVATHYDRFGDQLNKNFTELKPLYPLPPIKLARFVETAPAIGALILAQKAVS